MRWLLEHQEPDGSWFGRWGINHVYGTGAAVPGLIAAGVPPQSAPVRRAVRWLERHQNEDGGWGEDARSYDDPRWIGRGASTASQTAWALLALHAAGDVRRGDGEGRSLAGGHAARRRQAGTSRSTPARDSRATTTSTTTCTGSRFPVMALGRCLAARRGEGEPDVGRAGALERLTESRG